MFAVILERFLLLPLTIICALLSVHSLMRQDLISGAVFLVAGILFGMTGAALHVQATARDAKRTPSGDASSPPDPDGSRRATRAVLRTSLVCTAALAVLWVERGARWYLALAVAAVAWFVVALVIIIYVGAIAMIIHRLRRRSRSS